VGREICYNVNADLIVDSDGRPFDDDCIVIQIAKLLFKEDLHSKWMFSIKT
jgi:hypothetical protein